MLESPCFEVFKVHANSNDDYAGLFCQSFGEAVIQVAINNPRIGEFCEGARRELLSIVSVTVGEKNRELNDEHGDLSQGS